MITFFNAKHVHHQGAVEMFRGALLPCFEVAARVERVRDELRRRRLGAIEEPSPFDDAVSHRVHAPRYVDFLRGAWDEWVALNPAHENRDALPSVWSVRHFSFDVGTPLTRGAWRAARSGAACALSAAESVRSGAAQSAFALTRPPGRYSGYDFFGGYCFLNNAAIAAQALRDGGVERVAVLDVDYYHGNGTQCLFYDRDDVFFMSIHGDPRTEYPFFLGYADEEGAADGNGCNLNIPLPRGTEFSAWRAALAHGLRAIAGFRADAFVVSLGVDTFEADPISGFRLRSEDYLRVGEDLARAGLPTVFMMEGGYAVDEIGVNVANVLEGFEACRS